MPKKWTPDRRMTCLRVQRERCALRSTAPAADAPRVQLTVATDAPAPRSAATSSASLPSTWAPASMAASGSAGTQDPQHAWHPQRRGRGAAGHQRCPTSAGPAAATPTSTTGVTASAPGPPSQDPEPRLGRRDRTQQLWHARVHGPGRAGGRQAYVSINVGSGSVREMAEWLEYMTSAKPSSLAQERVRNGAAKPFRCRCSASAMRSGAAVVP